MTAGEQACRMRGSAAVLTPRGRGAVATIRLHGDLSSIDEPEHRLFQAVNGRPVSEQPAGRLCFGRWGLEVPEDVVLCRLDRETAEVHCHGGDAACGRIVNDLRSNGFQIVSWRDLSRTESSLLAAEAREALTQATTLRTATILLEQAAGRFESAVADLLAVASRSRDRREDAGRWQSSDRDQVVRDLADLLSRCRFGRHLTEPWSVVLAGRPNVGKSSLINALLGYTRSIVYHRPGTTRDVVTAETAFDGWPVRLSDTAGIRPTTEQIESSGVRAAGNQLARADCPILIVDASQPPDAIDWQLLADWPDAILVAGKCDLPDQWGEQLPPGAVRVSSVTGLGLADLVRQIVDHLVPEVPAPGTPIPYTERQIGWLDRAREALDRGDCREVCDCLQAVIADPIAGIHPLRTVRNASSRDSQ